MSARTYGQEGGGGGGKGSTRVVSFFPDRKTELDLRQRCREFTLTQKSDSWQIVILLRDYFTKTVIQSINQSLFANAITSKQQKVWQAARTGNSPTKLATLRQEDSTPPLPLFLLTLHSCSLGLCNHKL